MTSCKQKLDVVIMAGVRPILVFDGAKLQMKEGTEFIRAQNRDEARRKAEEYLSAGDTVNAHKYFNIAVDITPELANCFIRLLRD